MKLLSYSLAYFIEIIKLDETLITIFIIVIMDIVFIRKVKLCERKTRGLISEWTLVAAFYVGMSKNI